MMERERNRRQARKSRTLKKQCTDRMQEQLTQLHKEAVSDRKKGNAFFMFFADDCRRGRAGRGRGWGGIRGRVPASPP